MTTIYLCGPITGCSERECMQWRLRAAQVLESVGLHAMNPLHRTGHWRGHEHLHEAEIVEGDYRNISACDMVLADFTALREGVYGIGSAMEVAHAFREQIPVVVVWPGEQPAPCWLSYHADIVLPTLEAALDHIAAMSD